jgi:hypothetical protein
MTNYRIPEIVVPGKRLGRHVNHDERSLAYAIPETDVVVSVQWPRVIPVLNQGDVGACTGNACTGLLGTQPDDTALAAKLAAGLVLDESLALTLYSEAETIDGDGPYPPNDNGSSGLSVAQAAKNAGLCSGYTHALSIAAAHTAIQAGPFMVGSDWYDSFDTTDANGLVEIVPGAAVRGGHEYECRGYDAPTDLWHFVNSWGESYGVAGEFYYSSATFEALLANDGDVTALVPLSQPAPTPAQPNSESVLHRLEDEVERVEKDIVDAILGHDSDATDEAPDSPSSPDTAAQVLPDEGHGDEVPSGPETGVGTSSNSLGGPDPVDHEAIAARTAWLQNFEHRVRGILALVLTRVEPAALLKEIEQLAEDLKKDL